MIIYSTRAPVRRLWQTRSDSAGLLVSVLALGMCSVGLVPTRAVSNGKEKISHAKKKSPTVRLPARWFSGRYISDGTVITYGTLSAAADDARKLLRLLRVDVGVAVQWFYWHVTGYSDRALQLSQLCIYSHLSLVPYSVLRLQLAAASKPGNSDRLP